MQHDLEESKSLARRFVAALSDGNLEFLATYFDDDSTWTIEATGIEGTGTHRGSAIIEDLGPVRGIFEAGDPKLEIKRLVAVPGIDAVLVGGHCPGQQVLLVAGERGSLLLASDAVHYYEELEREWPFTLFSDLEAMYLAYGTVRELGREHAAAIVPGHDPMVMERFPSRPEGIGVRLV